MKVVFIGASHFGLRCLKEMISLPCCEVVGAVTLPRTFSISNRPQKFTNILHADIKSFCEEKDINCFVMAKEMKEPGLLEQVQTLSPDIFIVVGWYHMVPKSWRELAPAYGLHASLLPDYSGGAPLVWAIINGETKTGASLFELSDGVDNGPIVGQLSADIYPEDTISTLYERIEVLGVELLQTHLPRLAEGSAKPVVQNENKRRVYPMRVPEDGKIDWSLHARQVYDFIRAQTKPYPGAFTLFGKDKITIWSSRVSGNKMSLRPAELKRVEKKMFVGCGDSFALEILDVAKNGIDISFFNWCSETAEPENPNRFS